jgi:hypothetical protein
MNETVLSFGSVMNPTIWPRSFTPLIVVFSDSGGSRRLITPLLSTYPCWMPLASA